MSDIETKTAAAKRGRVKRPPPGARGAQGVKAKIRARAAALAAVATDKPAAVVMLTSRYLGVHGRPVPRNRVARATADFAVQLISSREAREATAAEIAAAEAGAGVLELVG